MPKTRQFNYQPLYYDEKKEHLEQMKAAAAARGEEYCGLQKGFLQERRKNSRIKRAGLEKGSVIRFMMILVILLTIVYFVMPEVFHAMWK